MLPITIKKKFDFNYLKTYGVRTKTSSVLVVCALRDDKTIDTMVGYIVSKRTVGNAVKRNRAKRRLRSLVREYKLVFEPGDLFLIIATTNTSFMQYSLLSSDFYHCLIKAKEKAQSK